MKKTSKTIVFFGNERLATGVVTTAPTLRALADDGYKIACVISNHEAATTRLERRHEIATVAEEFNIPVYLPKSPKDILGQIADLKPDIGVLVAYGKIIPDELIRIFPYGIVNIHPSLLPKHRGPTPIEGTILQGDSKTGVSIMKLEAAMDAGPVYGQTEINLNGDESKQELADNLLEIGKAMLLELLPGILEGTVVALPQDHSRSTYDKLISKNDGVLDWNKPAKQLVREIRAFAGWPKSRMTLAGKDIIVTKAYAVPSVVPNAKPGEITVVPQAKTFSITTSNGSLWLERLKPADKNEMDAAAFLAGYGHLLK